MRGGRQSELRFHNHILLRTMTSKGINQPSMVLTPNKFLYALLLFQHHIHIPTYQTSIFLS